MYTIVINNDTDVVHAVDPFYADTGELFTLCGQWGTRFKSIITANKPTQEAVVESVTCKNCLRSLGAYTFQRKRIERNMKVYEFGADDHGVEPTWIKTNRNVRLTSAAKRTDKYLKEINSSFKGAAGIDLVIT